MIKSPYFFIFWLSLIIASYFFIDRPLAHFLHQVVSPSVYQMTRFISLLGLGLPYIILFSMLFLFSFFIIKNRYWIFCSSLLWLSVIVPGLFTNILKMFFGRSRPDLLFTQDVYGFYFFHFDPTAAYYSFPSGHATTVAGVATACFLLWRRFPFLIAGIAAIIIASRVVLTEHFLSDIMMGAYLGSIMTYGLYLFLQKTKLKGV